MPRHLAWNRLPWHWHKRGDSSCLHSSNSRIPNNEIRPEISFLNCNVERQSPGLWGYGWGGRGQWQQQQSLLHWRPGCSVPGREILCWSLITNLVQGALFPLPVMVLPRIVSNRICGLSSGRLWLICLCIAQHSAAFHMRQSEKCVFNGIMWAAPHGLASWLPMTLNAELGLLSLLPGSPLTCPMLLELSFEDLLKYGLWHPLENPDYTFTSHIEAALENSESKLKSLDTLKQWLSTFVILRPFNIAPTRWSRLWEENVLSPDKQLTSVYFLFPPKKGQEVLVRGLSPPTDNTRSRQ